jgi:serine/threonine protein kinase
MKQDSYEYVRVDALVAERLTSSPRIYDIYGSCGLGIISEFFPHGDMESVVVTGDGTMYAEELHDGYEVKPQNNLTGIEKLEIATQMAEALADLHGNKGGIIVHQDVQLSQYLWTADKSMVKLNDFNRAEFMLWDEEEQEYCKYSEGRGNGSVSGRFSMAPYLIPKAF